MDTINRPLFDTKVKAAPWGRNMSRPKNDTSDKRESILPEDLPWKDNGVCFYSDADWFATSKSNIVIWVYGGTRLPDNNLSDN